ncbi:C40 family peptidase [Sporosarcina ureae]|uniref:C40 family peptidase n=1 Tax=Sporosarcina ureae TaxID=1571 RepID=UPI0009DC7A53|nr:C40 family peptidase [Sporosarcina ureae]ARF18177.1 hydrolase [Sporosarcina ureae]
MNLVQKVISVLALSALLIVSPFAGQADAASKTTNITKTATSLTGIKYRYGGTTRAGFDCSGYVGYVFKQNGLKVARTSRAMYASGRAIKKSSLRNGDLVFFNTTGRGVSHVGIYVGNGKFAHASTSKGVRVDKVNDSYWGKRYIGAKRVAGI